MALHPGECIRKEMEVRNLSRRKLRRQLGWPMWLFNAVLDGEARINDRMAADLGRIWDNTPQMWRNIQAAFDAAGKPDRF